jgi:glycosyltransferase involved in cell wall biosynthesis
MTAGTVTRPPKVSVAIASYNYGSYLEACVRSALEQPGVDLEVIVVDDASTDNSLEIALALAEQDSRVTVVAHEQNRGHIATFNESLWLAAGDFVVKLDSDDMLTPGALLRGAQVLQAWPNVGLVYGNPLTFETEPPQARTAVTGITVWSGFRWIQKRCHRATNCIMQPEAMVRRSVLRQTGGHRASIPAAHDLNLWLRIAAVSDIARIRGADQGYYRVHSESLLRSVYGGYLSDLRQRRAAFDDFFATCDAATTNVIDKESLRERTHKRLAAQSLRYAARAYGRLDEQDVLPYVDFAESTWPGASILRERRALERRQQRELKTGPAASSNYPPFRVAEAAYAVQDALRWRRWRRFGT